MAKTPSTLTVLRDQVMVEQISKKRNGNYMFRQGYYYKYGKTSESFKQSITKHLDRLNMKYEVVDCGDQWRPFRGNASTANSSHFWCEVKIEE